MGICGGRPKSQEDQVHKLSQPIITNGELQIKVLLKNITLKMTGVRQCSIEFDLGQCKYTSPVHIDNNGDHYWRASFDGTLKMTEQQMRESNMKISVIDNQVIGSATINLFEAAVGPFHFQLPIRGQNMGNVSFDLKMNQVLQATLQSKFIIWELNQSLSDVRYNYNLRLVTSQFSFISEHSTTFVNPNYRKQNEKQKSIVASSRKSILDQDMMRDSIISLPKIPSMINSSGGVNHSLESIIAATPTNKGQSPASQPYHRIEWDHAGDELTLIVELPISEFQGSAIQLCLWSISSNKNSLSSSKSPHKTIIKKTQNKHDSEYMDLEIQDHHLVAETYINLSNLETNIIADLGAKFFIIKSQQAKSIWYHGVEVGKIDYEISVRLPNYLQQSSFGVQTEKGIVSTASVVGNVENISVTEIKMIQIEFQKLSSSIFKIEHKTLNMEDKLKVRSDMDQQLSKLAQLLGQSHGTNIKTFQYKSEDDLMKAQDLLIQLSIHLVDYSKTLASFNSYFECLNQVLSRGELMLQQLGFFKALSKKQSEFKTEVGLNYQSFLVNTLRFTLSKLNQKDPSQEARQLYIKYLVISYFRIPEFRAKFLELINKSDDPQLLELRGTEFIQEDDPTNIDKSTKTNISIFDWQNYFHTYLSDKSKGIQNQSALNQILDDESWKEHIRHRSINFSFFVEEWAKYVRNILQVKILPWQDIPGYRILVKAFMCELKQQESIPDAMKIALKSLLQNVNLLGIVVSLQFNKTNLYNAEQVIETFEILDVCFGTLTTMPAYFDYPFFLKGIKQIIIESEHAINIAKCVWLIYNIYPLFSMDFKKDICEFLFEKAVFKLFLHWSRTVRLVFHYFLLYRVSHQHKNPKVGGLDEEQIIQQYTLINRPKKNQSYFENRQPQQQLISDYIYMKYLRFLSKLEQAKINENQREYQQDHQSYYLKMVHKKLRREQELKMQQQEEPKMMEQLKLERMISEQDESQQNDRSSTSYAQEVELQVAMDNDVDKHEVEINEMQQQYLRLSIREFEEQLKNYNNWRQQNLKKMIGKYNEEDKHTIHLSFEVPKVDVLRRIDEKEGA
ncbi:unnamed protein product (macronuclear) [Paramecium tetraurelia]|uniref:Uncharacterized protein n=1 Tax=Paramecium tetraurelia TaxID=5888 RepID=A0CD25_PARTE|nr:uncharacterized protein GSPATT00037477001 [Paramecium tetraurelia]CAK68692.1 unnamed protein product [Paramecium tetraurelia]|eukprot:XP_001436089.1 hypothetical protein (macronuclear) [Paramecium tetraurelia strain d4-2]